MTRRSRPGRPAARPKFAPQRRTVAKSARGKGGGHRPSGLPPAPREFHEVETGHAPGDRKGASPSAGESDEGTAERLQKFMAATGVGSRRHCEELILAGRVEVDGKTITKLGTKVSPGQEVYVDGVQIKIGRKVYYLVNKPVGVVTTNHDPSGRQRVIDLLPATQERLFAVGRLDRASDGLILVTNDGELAQRLTHPRYGIQKTYRVQVAGSLDRDAAARLVRGIHLSEGVARADAVIVKSAQKQSTWIEMILSEGRNREVRRLLAKVGHKVLSLRRIAVGPLKLRDLAPGEFRQLTPPEVKQLWREALTARKKRKPAPAAAAGATAGEAPSPKTKSAVAKAPRAKPRDEDFDDEELLEDSGDVSADEERIAPAGGRSAAEDVLIADDVEIGGRRISGGPAPTILGADEEDADLDDEGELSFAGDSDDEDDEDEEFDFELDDKPRGPHSGLPEPQSAPGPQRGVRGPRVMRPKGTRPGKRLGERQGPQGPPAGFPKGRRKGKRPGKGPGKGPGGKVAGGGGPRPLEAAGESRPAGKGRPAGKPRRAKKGGPGGFAGGRGPGGGPRPGKRKVRAKVRRGKGRK